MKIVTQHEVENRLKNIFPNQPFEIIEYTKTTKPFIIKCLKCGEIKQYANCRGFFTKSPTNKTNICHCYNLKSTQTIHQLNEEKILQLCKKNPSIEFLSFGFREHTNKYTVNILCNKCNQKFNKDLASFLKNQTCPFCESNHNLNTQGFKANLPDEYELISEYKDTETKILVKHSCGFIWKVKPHNLISRINSGYCGCPKCNHKRSKGENKIANWLLNNNKIFIEQQIFLWQSNPKFRYDFYLPQQQLIIEYMGQQHYQEVSFFHDTLAERQEHDQIKQLEAQQHNLKYLIISYQDFNNIETILQDWFNDYPEMEQGISD